MQALQSHALKKVSPTSFHFEIPDVTGIKGLLNWFCLSIGILCLYHWNSKMLCLDASDVNLEITSQGFSANKGP